MQVPILPLPHLVIFPHTVFPLEICEPRYRSLVFDLLDDNGRFCIAHLKPPGAHDDLTLPPPVYPLAPIGRLINATEHRDGRFSLHFLAEGRARLEAELPQRKPYREVEVQTIREQDMQGGIELKVLRSLLINRRGRDVEGVAHLLKSIDAADPVGEVADVAAHLFLVDSKKRLALFSELDPQRRLRTLISHLSDDLVSYERFENLTRS